jgi:hypothetical protein
MFQSGDRNVTFVSVLITNSYFLSELIDGFIISRLERRKRGI